MEMVCQPSYPLNSENASPFGTLREYLSSADMTLPPTKTTSTTAMITVSQDEILAMAHSSVVICIFSSKSTVGGANRAVECVRSCRSQGDTADRKRIAPTI